MPPTMDPNGLRARIRRREPLCGTFVKTRSHEIVEVLALSGLDFICLDAEHSAWDRSSLDVALAVARAHKLPCLVRVADGSASQILAALDSGATGIVVPHCDSAEKIAAVAKAAHFGHGGRGFAGSTRWAGFQTKSIADVLAMDVETVVLGQIEEPEGVEAIDEIAAVPDVDGLFVGPADIAVCYGETDISHPKVRDAIAKVNVAAEKQGKSTVTFAPTTAFIDPLKALGVNMFFLASEQAWMLSAARGLVSYFKEEMKK